MPELTVASFNTHWGVDRQGQPFDVVGVCLALAADVLVLQEAWRPHGEPSYLDELAERMGAVVHETVFMSDRNPARPRLLHPKPGPAGTCGLAVLSTLPVCEVAEIVLPRAQGDVIEQRHSLLVTVSVDGTAVSLAAMHASHRLWGSLPQVRCVDRALPARGATRARSSATSTCGARPSGCRSRAGSGPCAGARGPRAARTARSTTCGSTTGWRPSPPVSAPRPGPTTDRSGPACACGEPPAAAR